MKLSSLLVVLTFIFGMASFSQAHGSGDDHRHSHMTTCAEAEGEDKELCDLLKNKGEEAEAATEEEEAVEETEEEMAEGDDSTDEL